VRIAPFAIEERLKGVAVESALFGSISVMKNLE
jgi:hypothetical protein